MFETRIAKGIARLDRLVPDWPFLVNPDRLDMGYSGFVRASDCGCVFAQLERSGKVETHPSAVNQFDRVALMVYGSRFIEQATEEGFWLSDDVGSSRLTEEYKQLTKEWRGHIWARRADVWPGAVYVEED